ncbi:hypothetical protein GCM10007148_07400 [Parvularcula lutaonensis]|nr:hypothetical protein GCM10007148_07400 [Parvularcula lutaonensis]
MRERKRDEGDKDTDRAAQVTTGSVVTDGTCPAPAANMPTRPKFYPSPQKSQRQDGLATWFVLPPAGR